MDYKDVLEWKASFIMFTDLVQKVERDGEVLCAVPLGGISRIKEHKKILEAFAFEEPVNLEGFRRYLHNRREDLFWKRYYCIANLTNEELTYVLGRIREERISVDKTKEGKNYIGNY